MLKSLQPKVFRAPEPPARLRRAHRASMSRTERCYLIGSQALAFGEGREFSPSADWDLLMPWETILNWVRVAKEKYPSLSWHSVYAGQASIQTYPPVPSKVTICIPELGGLKLELETLEYAPSFLNTLGTHLADLIPQTLHPREGLTLENVIILPLDLLLITKLSHAPWPVQWRKTMQSISSMLPTSPEGTKTLSSIWEATNNQEGKFQKEAFEAFFQGRRAESQHIFRSLALTWYGSIRLPINDPTSLAYLFEEGTQPTFHEYLWPADKDPNSQTDNVLVESHWSGLSFDWNKWTQETSKEKKFRAVSELVMLIGLNLYLANNSTFPQRLQFVSSIAQHLAVRPFLYDPEGLLQEIFLLALEALMTDIIPFSPELGGHEETPSPTSNFYYNLMQAYDDPKNPRKQKPCPPTNWDDLSTDDSEYFDGFIKKEWVLKVPPPSFFEVQNPRQSHPCWGFKREIIENFEALKSNGWKLFSNKLISDKKTRVPLERNHAKLPPFALTILVEYISDHLTLVMCSLVCKQAYTAAELQWTRLFNTCWPHTWAEIPEVRKIGLTTDKERFKLCYRKIYKTYLQERPLGPPCKHCGERHETEEENEWIKNVQDYQEGFCVCRECRDTTGSWMTCEWREEYLLPPSFFQYY